MESGKRSSTYISWCKMLERCKSNPLYIANGITVCEEWKSFETFLLDMGERPKGTSLDRVNNEGHYNRDNCRWATARQQQRNKSTNRLITHNGTTRCLTDWAELLGINTKTLWTRLNSGWSIERALTP